MAGYRLVELGTLGGDSSFALAMNNRSDVVGCAQAAEGTYYGFIWRHGRMTDLGAFTRPTSTTAARSSATPPTAPSSDLDSR
ncbi:hypothetical protein ACQPYV_30405 [Micromonospora saelicesensis]|uniref:hypothetical protein n=1 Tax=Micromonospora saelicesensis TaxID=285676 RepID=UPI003D8B731D